MPPAAILDIDGTLVDTQELREAGAAAVFESVAELRSRLGETPLTA